VICLLALVTDLLYRIGTDLSPELARLSPLSRRHALPARGRPLVGACAPPVGRPLAGRAPPAPFMRGFSQPPTPDTRRARSDISTASPRSCTRDNPTYRADDAEICSPYETSSSSCGQGPVIILAQVSARSSGRAGNRRRSSSAAANSPPVSLAAQIAVTSSCAGRAA